MSEEVWKDIAGYEGMYQVSNKGRVRSLDRISPTKCNAYKKTEGKELSKRYNSKGYLQVTLYNGNSHGKSFKVHRLVAQAFIPNPENKPQVNHKDLNKSNNCVENLEWVTSVENARHAWDNGAGKPIYGKRPEYWRRKIQEGVMKHCAKPVLQMDDNCNVIAEYNSIKEAGLSVLGKRNSHISDCCNGKRRVCGGYKWRYKDDC